VNMSKRVSRAASATGSPMFALRKRAPDLMLDRTTHGRMRFEGAMPYPAGWRKPGRQ
jgi:hypothetical protein